MEKFYDGVVFHRVIEGLWPRRAIRPAQAAADLGKNLEAEFSNEPHVRGIVSTARANHPDSADSQFFICFDDAKFLYGRDTVWGKVIEGMENIDKVKRGEPVKNPDKMDYNAGWRLRLETLRFRCSGRPIDRAVKRFRL